MERWIYNTDHRAFRSVVRRWLEAEVVPQYDQFEAEGFVPRDIWKAAGSLGLLGLDVPSEFGGGDSHDWRFNAVLEEEIYGLGVPGLGIPLHNDIVIPYITAYANDEQKERWLPGMVTGDLIGALAMTEPGTGSDLAAISTRGTRHGDTYIVNGSKTFISNGLTADLIITVVRTDPNQRHRGLSIIVFEQSTPGFERGGKLRKIGLHAQDTAELLFNDATPPASNLLGEEGQGFELLMANLAQERLVVAVTGIARARAIFEITLDYCKTREAFGTRIGSFQANRFTLAEMATELEIAQTFVDRCIELHCESALTAAEAAMAKWWITDLENKVIDGCLQLHGGYGYMEEYPVARAFRDARVQRIYAGTNEIMKEIIGRALGL